MKRSAMDHPKLLKLMRVLEIPRYSAVGLLESLWHFTAKFAPTGGFNRFSDEDLAQWIAWEGTPDKLINALVECGWLDRCGSNRMLVHDWAEHADQGVKKHLLRTGRTFDVHVQVPDDVQTCPDMDSLPVASASASAVSQLPEPVIPPNPPEGGSTFRREVEKFKGLWNELPPPIPKLLRMGKGRLRRFKARLNDNGWLDEYPKALHLIPSRPFLMGDKGWVANVDWFLQPDSVTKIKEGQYKDAREETPLIFESDVLKAEAAAREEGA